MDKIRKIEFVKKNISITKKQSEFIDEECLSLSKIVQKKLEEMKNDK